MTTFIDIDLRGLNRRISELHDAMVGQGGDVREIVKDENKRLLKQIIGFTPPNQGRVSNKSKALGEHAVSRDINRAVQPIIPGDFKGPRLRARIVELLLAGAANTLEHILRKVADPLARVEFFHPKLHNRVRDRRGRVQRNKHMFAIPLAPLVEYRRKTISHVGRMVAALLPSYEAAGGIVRTGWIKRHRAGTRGRVVAELQGQKPFIRTIWRARGVGVMRHIVNSAQHVRRIAIGKRIRLVVSGYNKQIKAKMIVSRQNRTSALFAETGEV